MNPNLYNLNEMLNSTGEENTSSLLSTFKCSMNPDAEDFLKTKSIAHEKYGISRTYLAVDKKSSEEGYFINGYFTLAIKCIAINENHILSNKLYSKMNIDKGIAQTYLLGQLARADDTEIGLGKKMIYRALDIFTEGNKIFGCRVIRLDCKDEPKLIRYYRSCGFTLIGKNQDNTLNQMITII